MAQRIDNRDFTDEELYTLIGAGFHTFHGHRPGNPRTNPNSVWNRMTEDQQREYVAFQTTLVKEHKQPIAQSVS